MSRMHTPMWAPLCLFTTIGLLVMGQGPVTTSPVESVPSDDSAKPDPLDSIKLFCALLPVEGSTPPRTRVLAFLVNEADRPLPIYVLGFFGPDIWKQAKVHMEPMTLTERTSSVEQAPENIIELRPHSVFGREYVMSGSPSDVIDTHKVSCHYIVYKKGSEGKADSIRGVIYPDRVDRVTTTKTGRTN